ncbi:MAG TPA: flagellar basal body P-ring formation chaperone FlgA [Verrucomicrobiae bacterium]|jgi:flagella basal body P-ring formation protein FlgA
MIILHNFKVPVGNLPRPKFWPKIVLAIIGFSYGFINCPAAEPSGLQLAPVAEVTSEGVFFQQVVKSSQPLPALRLCDAPQMGATLELSRSQINDFLAVAAPNLMTTNWSGADSIRISRRARTLNEASLITLLTESLQKNYVKDRGDLELNLTQPWDATVVPDEPLTVKVLELPTEGVTRSFIVRFQLCTATDIVGTWDVTLQAHIWRNVWVAHSDLLRGELLADADVMQDRRDILTAHEPLADFPQNDATLELADSVPADHILFARDLKLRAIIHRGQVADAVVQDGSLNVSAKVQALEDGAPGQLIRARNVVSQRDLTGKVLDDHTIEISL